jgi:hypothetical protein
MGISKINKEKQDRLDPIAYERYCNGESITRIAKDFKMDRNKLSKRLQVKYGIKACMDGGKKNIDSNYFTVMNHENVYWLGLILADGCINKKNKFELTLKDREHIELFKECLKSEHKISPKEINGELYHRISFSDTQIVNDLKKYGILPNKSNIDFHLPDIPDEFFNDFLRGIIDGDGMIYSSKINDSRFHIYISVGFSCPTYMQELCEKIRSFYKVDAKYSIQRTCYRIQIYKKDSVKIVKQLYKNASLYMKRKYEKCIKYL